MKCLAREYRLKMEQERLTIHDKLDIEILVRLSCVELRLLEKLYNKLCIREAQEKKDKDNSTTQEGRGGD